jgi:hypothetical protein
MQYLLVFLRFDTVVTHIGDECESNSSVFSRSSNEV